MTNETNGQTLLQKALAERSINRGRIYDSDEEQILDLALAYCRCEITSAQAAKALGKQNVVTQLVSRIVTAARHGIIRIERVEADKEASA